MKTLKFVRYEKPRLREIDLTPYNNDIIDMAPSRDALPIYGKTALDGTLRIRAGITARDRNHTRFGDTASMPSDFLGWLVEVDD